MNAPPQPEKKRRGRGDRSNETVTKIGSRMGWGGGLVRLGGRVFFRYAADTSPNIKAEKRGTDGLTEFSQIRGGGRKWGGGGGGGCW